MGPYDGSRTLILGHRGASAHAPDNTLAGFQLALDDGADGVELDVRRSADGALVLHHEPSTEEVGVIAARDFSDIRALDPTIPTLDEALEVLSGNVINVEIKNAPGQPDYDPDNAAAHDVAEWVRAHDLYETVIVSSFNPAAVVVVRKHDPAIATALLSFAVPLADVLEAAATAGHCAIHPDHASLAAADAARVVATSRSRGLEVATWTVNDPDAAADLARAGLAAIVTDDPGLLRRTLG
jgi:glycerophosphoryl diester phosphodiesterase